MMNTHPNPVDLHVRIPPLDSTMVCLACGTSSVQCFAYVQWRPFFIGLPPNANVRTRPDRSCLQCSYL